MKTKDTKRVEAFARRSDDLRTAKTALEAARETKAPAEDIKFWETKVKITEKELDVLRTRVGHLLKS